MNWFKNIFKRKPMLADKMRELARPPSQPVSDKFCNEILCYIEEKARNKQRILEFRYSKDIYWKDVDFTVSKLKQEGFECELTIYVNEGGRLVIMW